MDRTEYLEKLFGDAFKREADQDENVARSLPFVAASLALLVTVLNLAGQHLPQLDLSAYSIAVHLLVMAAGVSVAGVLWYVVEAVRPRSYRYPPSETETMNWSIELERYYAATGLAGPALQDVIVSDLRQRMMEEFGAAAAHNRANNAKRLGARAQALLLLMTALGFVFAAAGLMFIEERFAKPNPLASSTHGPNAIVKTQDASTGAPTTTAVAVHH